MKLKKKKRGGFHLDWIIAQYINVLEYHIAFPMYTNVMSIKCSK